jgi:hypothetical protein
MRSLVPFTAASIDAMIFAVGIEGVASAGFGRALSMFFHF